MTVNYDVWKSGRGGARPGSGRPPKEPDQKAQKERTRSRFAFSLSLDEGAALRAAAEAEGVTPHNWIVRVIRRNLLLEDTRHETP